MLSAVGEYESSDDNGYEYDVAYRRQSKQWHQQEIFSNSDGNTDIKTWGRNDVILLRRPSKE